MNKRNLATVLDLTTNDILTIFDMSARMKKSPDEFSSALKGKILGMIFEKSSTRTRVSFESGIYQLGGTGLFLSKNDLQLGRGETISDTAKVLSRYVDILMARTFSHDTIIDLAKNASIPVINGLSDMYHPCQSLTDFFTIYEYKHGFKNKKIVYIGDGNNVLHSLLLTGALLGARVDYATPEGYEPDSAVIEKALSIGAETGFLSKAYHNPVEAVKNADVIYTDVWASMGMESEADTRKKVFLPYQINSRLVSYAKPDYIFMHCLPAHRGDEVTSEVADSKNSVIFDQAENRLHVQKAIMNFLLK